VDCLSASQNVHVLGRAAFSGNLFWAIAIKFTISFQVCRFFGALLNGTTDKNDAQRKLHACFIYA
jgi:hypothetical protein